MSHIFNTSRGRTVAKIALASQLFQFVFVPIASAVGQGNNQATSTLSNYAQTQAINSVEAWLNQYGNSRIKTHYDFDAEKFDDSSIDMLFALKDNGSDVTFTQFGFRNYDNRNTVNLGLGYRQLDEHYLWGVNGFYDRDLTGQNDRVSLGAEYFRDYLRINANSYFGLTNWHNSDDVLFEGDQTILLQEKPADGVDIMMNAYLPDYPQLGLKLGYEHYFGDHVNLFGRDELNSNPYAVNIGLHHTPVPLVTWGVDHKQGKHGADDTRLYLGLNYRFGETWENQINTDNVNALRTFNVGRLDLVERNNVITLDYRRKPVETTATQSPIATSLSLTTIQDNALANDKDVNIVEAVVRDQNGRPFEGEVVIFKDMIGNTIGVATTDSNGVARLEIQSGQPGLQTIVAELQSNPSVVKQTPANFTDPSVLAQATLALKSIMDNAIANNVDTNLLEATLVGADGKPLANINVNFVDENGTLVAKGTTGANGVVQGILSSSVAGTKNITAVVPATDIRSNTVPSTFIPIANPQDATQIDAVTTIDGALANGQSTNTVTATVLDKNNQPLAGIEIEFLDATGKVISTASTNNQGIATTQIPSSVPGSKSITARVAGNTSVQDQTDINFIDESLLQGGQVSLALGTNNSPADDMTNNTLEATVLDKNGNPAAGISVDFINKATGEVITTGTTDSTGKAVGNITSTTPGDIIIEAVVSGSNPPIKSPPATTTFVPPRIATTVDLVVTKDGSVANGQAINTVKATVKDQTNNVLPNTEIEFLDTAGNVLNVNTPLFTNANGEASFDLTSLEAGMQPITVRVKNNPTVTVTKPVTFIADASTAKITSVTPQTPTLTADGLATTPIEILVTDANGNILAGYPIESITDSTGNIYTGPFTTDENGKVTVNSLPSTTPKIVAVTATLANGSTGSENIEFVQSLENATIDIAADQPMVVADGTSTTIARGILSDQFGNPITNQEIDVEITLEGVTTKTRVTTGPQGEYAVPVPSSDIVGAIANITATTVNLPTNITAKTSVLFNGDIATAKVITLTPSKSTLIANNTNSPDNLSVLTATVNDKNGNIVIGVEASIFDENGLVLFTGVTDKNGQIQYTYSSYDPNNRRPVGNVGFTSNIGNAATPDAVSASITLTPGTVQIGSNTLTTGGSSVFSFNEPYVISGVLTNPYGNTIGTKVILEVILFDGSGNPILLTQGEDYTLNPNDLIVDTTEKFSSTITFIPSTKITTPGNANAEGQYELELVFSSSLTSRASTQGIIIK